MLLDTNVVSEAMAPSPDPAVMSWLDEIESAAAYVSAITIAEIRLGLALLPEGLRRSGLSRAFDQFVSRGFVGRVLPFDEMCAGIYADMVATRMSAGRPVATLDVQIAAIAVANGLAVATRNVRDFDGLGVAVVNPFDR